MMNKKSLYCLMTIMMVAFLGFGFASCSSDDEDGDLTGIWVHNSKSSSAKFKYDYVYEFKDGKVFEEEIWQYSTKSDFMSKYNSPSNWHSYSFSNGVLRVGGFSSKVSISGDTFTYVDGDGKKQTFNRWSGGINTFVDNLFGGK